MKEDPLGNLIEDTLATIYSQLVEMGYRAKISFSNSSTSLLLPKNAALKIYYRYIAVSVIIKVLPDKWPTVTAFIDEDGGESPPKIMDIDLSTDKLDNTLFPVLAKYDKEDTDVENEWRREREEKRLFWKDRS